MKAEEIMAEDQQKILVVDDERLNINVLVDLLKPNYKMMAAKNGEQALKAVQIANPPDLILLDIMMPEMDGYEVCRRLKADETTRDIPVIFVTAMGETSDETKGLELGAVDYLTKPISPPIVEARVKTHLALRRNMAELQKAYGIIEAQKDRMEEELNVGRDIQMSMVPQKFPAFPDRDEFSIHAALHPAREVGGDFYDFFFIDENRLCLCVGDVSGKGVPAALFMAVTRTLIKARASDDRSTASILTRVNDEISRDNKAYMFVTLFVGILDTVTGEMVYTNAGHNPTYFRRADGSLERLDTLHGPVVGAREGLAYREDKVPITKDDILLMYTDGVTEARNPEKEFFEEQRLRDLLSAHEFDSAEAVVEATVSAVKQFEDGADQFDDITVLALQFLKQPEAAEIPILDMKLKNQLTEIDRFKESFNAFSEENEIPTPIRRELKMVFDELLNNVVSYAYQDDHEHEIEVRVEVAGERIVVSIADDGIPFNPFDAAKPDTSLALEERAIGGLGIHLVLNVMDKVAYQRRTDKNVLNMVKKLTGDK
jgi:sigma-B regulation protein RsbU (phosphoserine phosphatase)